MMKDRIKNIVIYCMAVLAFAACTDENEVNVPSSNEGIPTTLELSFEGLFNKNIVVSRATPEEETHIYNLRIYVFNATGKLTGYKLLDASQSESIPSNGDVTIQTKTGRSYIYAIANMATSQYWVDKNKHDLLNVDNIPTSDLTREKFLDIIFEKQDQALSPLDNTFLMSGYANSGESVVIGETGITSPTSKEQQKINLYRVLSKNTFEFRVDDKSQKQFTLERYELHNVATGGKLIPSESTISEVQDLGIVEVTTGNNISFYLPENLRSTNAVIGEWKDREKDQYNEGVRSFQNAAPNSSYIVVYGRYEEEGTRTANVSYTIHLGNFGESLSDFNVRRNYNYQYVVTIKGVDDIVVEANCEGNNPYVEGIVIDYDKGGEAYTLDAHYEARVMRFNQKDIKSLKDNGQGYVSRITTYFGETANLVVKGNGVYKDGILIAAFESTQKDGKSSFTVDDSREVLPDIHNLFTGEADYQWVKFVRNVEDVIIKDQKHSISSVCRYPGDDNPNVIDIFSLLRKLYLHADDTDNSFFNQGTGENKYVYYSCFIDENYYPDKSWSEYVNKETNRIMYIANKLSVSEDDKSLHAQVAYTLSQRPIWTFYDRTKDRLSAAYGVESVSEEIGHYAFSKDDYTSSEYNLVGNQNPWDGYTIATNILLTKDWHSDNKVMKGQQDIYTKVAKACMSRNRDLNGDGKIQGNEIRWYLATVDQYRGLWIGENVLPAETRLFTFEDMKTLQSGHDSLYKKWHYYTASYESIFWPEEGVSTSRIDQGEEGDWWSQAENVRCVRTLVSGENGLRNPTKFYDYNRDSKTITMEYVNEDIFRSKQYGSAFGPHKERDEQNGITREFEIDAEDLFDNNEFSDWYVWSIKGVSAFDDVCHQKKGGDWRLPNQRELALMVSISLEEGNNWIKSNNGLWCSTGFYGNELGANGGYKKTEGFVYSVGSGNITVSITSTSPYNVRCVRDK